VVAGYSWNGSNDDVALVRYNADGSLDTGFDGDGKVTTAIGTGYDEGYSVIQQADGKLVVAGTSYNGSNNDFALVRYNADGALDTGFDGDGKVTTAIGGGDDVGYSVIQQADGKLVVAGYSHNGSDSDVALVRYNADGSLDTGFDGDGKVTTAIGAGDDYGRSVIQQADGKLVVAGHSSNGNNYDVALVRYDSPFRPVCEVAGGGARCREDGGWASLPSFSPGLGGFIAPFRAVCRRRAERGPAGCCPH
jgi:uncharacterized delta-60 repeat protein